VLVVSSDNFSDYVKEYDRRVLEGISKKNEGEYGGIDLIVEDWGGSPTFPGIALLIKRFDLNLPSTVEELQEDFDDVADLISSLEFKVMNKVVRPINNLSEVTRVGGVYSVGWDGRKLALMFNAGPSEVEDLMSVKDRINVATTQQENAELLRCVRSAVDHIKSADLGRASEVDAQHLNEAIDILEICGLSDKTKDVRLALKSFDSNIESAREYIYGPTGHGTNRGALYDLITFAESLEKNVESGPLEQGNSRSLLMHPISPYIVYQGSVYKKVAYDLPKDMKGVEKCKPEDFDPKRDPADQEWCTYSYDGKLRGRFRKKKDALQHKVFLINMYWQKGKGKNKPKGKYWRKK